MKRLKTSARTMILLRWCTGRSNFDVVRVFQRWDGRGQGAGPGGLGVIECPPGFSLTQARTWKFWSDAHDCARSPVARCPGYSTCGCASAFLGSSFDKPRGGSWYPTIVGVTSVSFLLFYSRKSLNQLTLD